MYVWYTGTPLGVFIVHKRKPTAFPRPLRAFFWNALDFACTKCDTATSMFEFEFEAWPCSQTQRYQPKGIRLINLHQGHAGGIIVRYQPRLSLTSD